MKKIMKSKKGITLISLVVTIIILLILAGISIGMLSGDNGILGQAGNAKTQTDIAGEKEIIDLAVVHAMGKSKYGDIDETYFTNELEKNNATVTKSGSKYKVTFSSGRQYEVDQDGNVKEKKFNPNALEISELNENASKYFGYDVINYAETLPIIDEGQATEKDYTDTKWQLFYAGALDIDATTAATLGLTEAERTEERIYLISKEIVKNTLLPAKNGATPIPISGSIGKAKFGSSASDGIMPQYTSGSSLITQAKIKALNSAYFKENYSSTNPNMKAVAYMLDTATWSPFADSSKYYAEWAIGGPTVELLFKAYNKYAGTAYESNAVSSTGYQVRKTLNDSFTNEINSAIVADTGTVDNPYSIYNISNRTGASAYWLASPSFRFEHCITCINQSGNIEFSFYDCLSRNPWFEVYAGFRPVVLLNSNYTLEKTKDSNGNDAFKIVEQ